VRWRCARCGAEHDGVPLDWAFEAPAYWDGGRGEHDVLTSDFCTWTDDDGVLSFFVRGVLHVPVPELGQKLGYGVWSSLSEESFVRVQELADDPPGAEDAGYFGWLSNSIAGYPETLNLPVDVVRGDVGIRPSLVLHGGDHPLIAEQHRGIGVERVLEIATLNMHG
jgi:hypothetical protein